MYYYDNNGKPIIVERNNDITYEKETHDEVNKAAGNIGGGLKTSRYENRNDTERFTLSQNGRTTETDGRFLGRTLPGQRRSNRAGYTESGNNIDRNEEADGLTPAFSMPKNKYSVADDKWDESIDKHGAIDENAEVKVPKSVDGEKAVTRLFIILPLN